CRGRRAPAPEHVREPVSRNDLVRAREQKSQERPLQMPSQSELTVTVANLDRPEDAVLHPDRPYTGDQRVTSAPPEALSRIERIDERNGSDDATTGQRGSRRAGAPCGLRRRCTRLAVRDRQTGARSAERDMASTRDHA